MTLRRPPPPKRPLPPPRTEGLMPLTCAGCFAERGCIQREKYNGHGQAWCKIVPAYFRV
jgi:hypothetical protein